MKMPIVLNVLFLMLPALVVCRPTDECKCVPKQWEGVLASVEREFDLRAGQAASSENNMYVHYDYLNNRFAMTDLNTGNKAIANYNSGYKYVVKGDQCYGVRTKDPMRQMCLPDHADYLGQFHIGADIPISIWQFSGPHNMTLRTTVIRGQCLPITEEVLMNREHYVSLMSSIYLDLTQGIKDPSVFEPPQDCKMDDIRNYIQKRSSDANPAVFQQMLKNRLFNYN